MRGRRGREGGGARRGKGGSHRARLHIFSQGEAIKIRRLVHGREVGELQLGERRLVTLWHATTNLVDPTICSTWHNIQSPLRKTIILSSRLGPTVIATTLTGAEFNSLSS